MGKGRRKIANPILKTKRRAARRQEPITHPTLTVSVGEVLEAHGESIDHVAEVAHLSRPKPPVAPTPERPPVQQAGGGGGRSRLVRAAQRIAGAATSVMAAARVAWDVVDRLRHRGDDDHRA